MSTILVPNIEVTCPSYNTKATTTTTEIEQQQFEKETQDNLDLIVTFLNLPQTKTTTDCQNYNEKELSPNPPHIENSMEMLSADITCLSYNCNNLNPVAEQLSAAAAAASEAASAEETTLTTLTNCSFYAEVPAAAQQTEPTNDAKVDSDEVADDDDDGLEDDDSDEEELTNLTWLTELRNQSITWPNSINPTILDDNMNGSYIEIGDKNDVRNVTGNDIDVVGGRTQSASSALTTKTINGQKVGLLNATTNKSQVNNDIQGKHVMAGPNGNSKAATMQAQLKRPTPAERYQIFIDKVKRDLLEYEQSAINYQTDTAEKPPFNYSHIIGMAMLEKGRVTLQQICSWIESKFAFFRVRKKWNNSIRHNLSLHHCFRKINRNKYEKGKGGYWELGVDPKKCDRKRIRNRKSSSQKKKLNQQKTNPSNNSSYDETAMATSSITAGIDVDVGHSMQHVEELLLDDMDVQHNIDISSSNQQQQHMQSSLEQQLQQEEAFIANVLANCIEIENVSDITEVTNEMPIATTSATATTTATNEPQYQLGTVIISTTAEDVAALNAVTTPINSFVYTNNNGSNISEYCQGQKILYREDEIPPACENVIVSSFLCDNVDSQHSTAQNPHRPNVIVEPLEPYYSVISASATTLVSANGDCTTIAGEHFRPYIDGIDEAFQYLRSMDNNRSEDILDNLLDISVSDY